jgi:TetR/AcrR family transcriptional repressor of bet genes
MARPSNTEHRRAQIAAALLKVMAKRGYDGASIADIATTARVASGVVHYHFKDKQEILLASLQHLVEQHDRSLERRLSEAGADPVQRVGAFIDFHLGLGADADPQALKCWVMLSGEALRQPAIRAEYEKAIASWTSQLAGIIRTGLELGSFQGEGAEAAATALIATIQGYFVLAAAAPAVIPRGSAARATHQMASGLLRPTPTLARAVRP